MESEPGFSLFVLTHFLHANRYLPPDQVRGQAFARKSSNVGIFADKITRQRRVAGLLRAVRVCIWQQESERPGGRGLRWRFRLLGPGLRRGLRGSRWWRGPARRSSGWRSRRRRCYLLTVLLCLCKYADQLFLTGFELLCHLGIVAGDLLLARVELLGKPGNHARHLFLARLELIGDICIVAQSILSGLDLLDPSRQRCEIERDRLGLLRQLEQQGRGRRNVLRRGLSRRSRRGGCCR